MGKEGEWYFLMLVPLSYVRRADMSTRDKRSLGWREILNFESRVFKIIGELNRQELYPNNPSVGCLLERKKHASERYSELLRDKMTLWEIREQLEASERTLKRILRER